MLVIPCPPVPMTATLTRSLGGVWPGPPSRCRGRKVAAGQCRRACNERSATDHIGLPVGRANPRKGPTQSAEYRASARGIPGRLRPGVRGGAGYGMALRDSLKDVVPESMIRVTGVERQRAPSMPITWGLAVARPQPPRRPDAPCIPPRTTQPIQRTACFFRRLRRVIGSARLAIACQRVFQSGAVRPHSRR